jgi:hypothetical protein
VNQRVNFSSLARRVIMYMAMELPVFNKAGICEYGTGTSGSL